MLHNRSFFFFITIQSLHSIQSNLIMAGVGSSMGNQELTPKPYPPPPRSSSTLKFLCSYGGKILPRYPDGKLRYRGGETRLLAVKKSISFAGQFFFLLPMHPYFVKCMDWLRLNFTILNCRIDI